nr:MAG TPA: hypothetical protein [Caudoviricetes sp.]
MVFTRKNGLPRKSKAQNTTTTNLARLLSP